MSNPTRIKDVQGAGQVDPTTGKKVSGGQYYFGREAGAAEVALGSAAGSAAATQDDLDDLGEKLGGMYIPAGVYSNDAVTTMIAFAKTYPNLADGAASIEEDNGVISIDVHDGIARLRTDTSGNVRHATYDDPEEELAVRRAMLSEQRPHSTYRPYDRLTVDDLEAIDEYQQTFGDDAQDSGRDIILPRGGVVEVATKEAGKDVIVPDDQFNNYLWEHVRQGRVQFPLAAEDRWVQYDGTPEADHAFGQFIDSIKDHPELLNDVARNLNAKGTMTANGKTVHVFHDSKWWA